MIKLKKEYNYYNKEFFGGELPTDIYVHYGKLGGQILGKTHYNIYLTPLEIIISNKLKNSAHDRQAYMTLLHEMCHVCTRADCEPRNGRWFETMRRIMRDGAFDDLV